MQMMMMTMAKMMQGELALDSRPECWLSVSIISGAFILHPLLKSEEQEKKEQEPEQGKTGPMGLANRSNSR